MKLFANQSNILKLIPEKNFSLEKEIQNLFESFYKSSLQLCSCYY